MSTASNPINNRVGASISGVTNTLTITNPSNTASSAARETITVGGGTAADPTLNFNVSGVTNFEMGIDNSITGDPFKIAASTALGTTDTFIMTTAGERTMPLQPAFSAYLSVTVNNVTGDSTLYTIISDTEVYDQGGNYNNATGVFTAPITGRYLFMSAVNLSNVGAANNGCGVAIHTSNRKYNGNDMNGNARDGANHLHLLTSIYADMDAADTAILITAVSGGAKTVGVTGILLANLLETYFQGSLYV